MKRSGTLSWRAWQCIQTAYNSFRESIHRVNEWDVTLLLGIYLLFVLCIVDHFLWFVGPQPSQIHGGKVVDLSMLRPRGSPRSPKRSPRSPRSPRQLRLLDPETAKLAEAWSGATVVKDERHWKDGFRGGVDGIF